MTKIRHFDSDLNRWIIDGASNASNLELTNPGFVDEKGNSISIDHGFTKLNNRMSKLEQNLAWIYLNGAKGGGGGEGGSGGGGGNIEYAFDMSYQSDTVYTTTNSTTLTLLIKSGNVSKTFKITVRGVKSGIVYVKDKFQRSLTRFTLDINGIQDNDELEVTAVDNNDNAVTPVYINVVIGALYLDMTPNKINTQIIYGNSVPNNYTFKVTNKTSKHAKFLVYVSNSRDPYTDGELPIMLEDVKTVSRSFKLSLLDLIEQSGNPIVVGTTYKLQFVAVQEDLNIKTLYRVVNVSIVASNRLIISTFNVSTDPKDENLTEFIQGNYVQIQCMFSYSKTDFLNFGYKYDVFKCTNDGEVLIDSGKQDSNIEPNKTFIIGYSTSKCDILPAGGYYKMTIKGFPTGLEDSEDPNITYSHSIYFAIAESDTSILKASNYNNLLLAYFGAFNFPNNNIGDWVYTIPTDENNEFYYDGTYKNTFKDIILKTFKVDGISSGFISDKSTNVTKLALTSGSYAKIDAFELLFPKYAHSLILQTIFSEGFCISCTFKAEESIDTQETVLSFGTYEDNALKSGFEITLNKARIKINGIFETELDLPVGVLNTVDLNVEPSTLKTDKETFQIYYFTLYLNGVMSACIKAFQDDVDWLFGKPLYLGDREDLSHGAICDIYDFKIYTQPQSAVSIVQNYISAKEQASLLPGGQLDESLDIELRNKNFFIGSKNEPCVLWDYLNNTYLEGDRLFNTLSGYVQEGTLNYPLVYLLETDPTSILKKNLNAVWTEGDKSILNIQHPVKIKLVTKGHEFDIEKPKEVTNLYNGPRVAIQGTSSLAYMSKNLELYMGDVDDSGKKLLLNVKDDWLPENEFTLKADVVDSGHVNNVAIGKILNDKNLKILENTPPMDAGNIWKDEGLDENKIRNKIKHTSDGFPCLLFMQFADGTRQFLGIFNFNLGRYAEYNLGLKILLDYTKPDYVTEDRPYLVTDYKYKTDAFNNSTYSLEVSRHNNNRYEAFSQADENTVRWMTDCRYTSKDDNAAYEAVTKNFYGTLAEMVPSGQEDAYIRSDATEMGIYLRDPSGKTYGSQADRYYATEQCGIYMNINNAMTYYVIAMLFGMVDSTCKNMTLRSWGGLKWYTCFYDMDTAFKMDNAGALVVAYDAHFHNFFNTIAQDEHGVSLGYTNAGDGELSKYQNSGIERFSKTGGSSGNHPEFHQYYASTWSRLWEALEYIPQKNSVETTSIGQIYWNLRRTVLKDPKQFIKKYYQDYVDQCGPILYNYDYRIKYLTIAKKYVGNELIDDSESKQESFLHGTRVDAVADWFEKRVYFLDSVYNGDKLKMEEQHINFDVKTPLNDVWNSNKAGTGDISVDVSIGEIGLSTKSKIKVATKLGNGSNIYMWSDEQVKPLIVKIPLGQQQVAVLANKYITNFENFKSYNWIHLDNINFPELISLDISNTTLLSNLFGGLGAYSNGVGLKNIKYLNLSGVKVSGTQTLSLDLTGCSKLENLNLSKSSYTSFRLPTSGSMRHLDLSDTQIIRLGKVGEEAFGNQPSLETINLHNCTSLEELYITNCESLKELEIPLSVKRLWIVNCANITEIINKYSGAERSPLVEVHIENCRNLLTINFDKLNNPDLDIRIIGCNNLKNVSISNSSIESEKLFLPALTGWDKLESLDISNTRLSYLQFIDTPVNKEFMDLSNFPNLTNLMCSDCQYIRRMTCTNNKENPIELILNAFSNCINLIELKGNFLIQGDGVFNNCYNLIFDLDVSLDFNEKTLNISFDLIISGYNLFNQCKNLNTNSFKYIMNRLPESLSSLESAFQGCIKIEGNVYRNMLSRCPNLTSLKDAFKNTNLKGILYSRNNYDELDKSTWGFFDYVPYLNSIEGAFLGTQIEAIDAKLFEPIIKTLANVDYCFAECYFLTSVEDSNALIPKESAFHSMTYFTQFRQLYNPLGFPVNMFKGCQKVKMIIDLGVSDTGVPITYLFHTYFSTDDANIINDSLYAGIHLIGEIGPNTFGGITRDLKEYKIPNITAIQSPFAYCVGKDITIKLDEAGKLFLNQPYRQLVEVFKNVKCTPEHDGIPNDLFKNCTYLNSISGLFVGMELTNKGLVYQFPNKDLFRDCVELQYIDKLFMGLHHLKIQLIGEGFENCKLKDISEAFKESGLFGFIPYRLWFMLRDGQIQHTILKMTNTFLDCNCLGYSSDRVINEKLSQSKDSFIPWKFGIPEVEGTPMYYTLEQPLVKTKNYNVDSKLTIQDVNDPDILIENPLYSPNELEYDIWQMDGRPWSKPEDVDEAVWKLWQKNYFAYDEKLQYALSVSLGANKYIEKGYLNYILPCDYFRYCADVCDFANSLTGINRQKWDAIQNERTGYWSVVETNKIEGLQGRIPCKLFEELKNIEKLQYIFDNIDTSAYVTLAYSPALNVNTRGIKFPNDLFTNNKNLKSVASLFSKNIFEVGVDINPDLFRNNKYLNDVSNLFSSCIFNPNTALKVEGSINQIPCTLLFENNKSIQYINGLFACNPSNSKEGPYLMDKLLFNQQPELINISNAFYYCTNMKGTVPVIVKTPNLTHYLNYLEGCNKNNIENRNDVTWLWPDAWKLK